ncbi:futalosine hydrolase [Paenibacillus paridis]|uniref:futalosine hydrolase n=1 Tax=Paenibacillus paridis TaxID=2583376 RepID=UPI001121B605|nr:futalosine hydrolase [Paenibacillus paridis]
MTSQTDKHATDLLHEEELHSQKRILIATAVEAERDAVLRGLGDMPNVDVIAVGVGAAAAAARTAAVLAKAMIPYHLVISAGIGGGFVGRADIGSLVVADLIVAADLGAETPEGFLGVDELGFGSARIAVSSHWNSLLVHAMAVAQLNVLSGPILTVTTATGTAETTSALAKRVDGAAAEGMEGYGVAVAATLFNLPISEIRAISNAVGPRDRAAWRIGEALASLEAASTAIREVLT